MSLLDLQGFFCVLLLFLETKALRYYNEGVEKYWSYFYEGLIYEDMRNNDKYKIVSRDFGRDTTRR